MFDYRTQPSNNWCSIGKDIFGSGAAVYPCMIEVFGVSSRREKNINGRIDYLSFYKDETVNLDQTSRSRKFDHQTAFRHCRLHCYASEEQSLPKELYILHSFFL